MERRPRCSCACPPGPIQTTTGSNQNDTRVVWCKITEQFTRSALCGSNELCLLSVACCTYPGSQHLRRAKHQVNWLQIVLRKRMQRKQGPHCCTLAYESGLQVDGLEGCKLTQGPMLSLHTLQTHYVQQYDLVLRVVWGTGRLDNCSRPHSAGTAAWSRKAHPSRTAPLASETMKHCSEFAPTCVMCCIFDLLPHRRWRAGSLRSETTAVLLEQLAV